MRVRLGIMIKHRLIYFYQGGICVYEEFLPNSVNVVVHVYEKHFMKKRKLVFFLEIESSDG